MAKKLLIIQVAGLGYDFLCRHAGPRWHVLEFRPLEPVFPAVTCTVQATLRTALPPAGHGMVANGLYLRSLRRPLFWEQSSGLVEGPRIWDGFRARGGSVGLLFWQQSLGEAADVLLSPAPIHKHHGGMIESCYSRPADLYGRLCRFGVSRPFRLRHYWGPRASAKAGAWIGQATAWLLAQKREAPDLCLTYLPTLDYDLQRYGPASPAAGKAMEALLDRLRRLVDAAADACDYDVLVVGDYAIGAVTGEVVYPNRALREARLLATRGVAGMLYPDFHASRAFAVVDHEVAHVYVRDPGDVERAADVLRDLPGYPWWEGDAAPDYATHVDIHNKPGYDPCELFFDRLPWRTGRDPAQIRGSHGRAGGDRRVAWAATCAFDAEPATHVELAAAVRAWLESD
jgi:predicted AlkP superfamily pyrophosphatase or phosphodiesterase